MYRFSLLMTIAFLAAACGKGNVPVMTPDGNRYNVQKVPASSYFEVVDAGVAQSFPDEVESQEAYEVDTITLGLSLEPEVGVGPLSVGVSTAVDFHFKEAK